MHDVSYINEILEMQKTDKTRKAPSFVGDLVCPHQS